MQITTVETGSKSVLYVLTFCDMVLSVDVSEKSRIQGLLYEEIDEIGENLVRATITNSNIVFFDEQDRKITPQELYDLRYGNHIMIIV